MTRTRLTLTQQQEITMSRLRIAHRILVVAGDTDHTLLIDPAWQRLMCSMQTVILKRKPGEVAGLLDELRELEFKIE
jgi:hypothetical protein